MRNLDHFNALSRTILIILVAGLVLFLMAVNLGFFSRFVVAPLDELSFKIREVERGNVDVVFESRGGDEIKDLERSFGAMVTEVRHHHQQEVKKEKEMALMVQDLKHQMEISAVNKQLANRLRELDLANRKIKRLASRLEEKNINLSKMVKRISAINRLGVALSAELETDRLIRLIVNVAVKGLRAEHGFLMTLDEGSGKLRLSYGMGLGTEYDPNIPIDMGDSISGQVAQTGEPVVIPTMSAETRFRRTSRYGFLRRSVICCPLRVKDRIVGTLELANKKGGETFNEEDRETLMSMCAQAAIAIDNAVLYQKIQRSYIETIRALVQAVEEKDRYTRGHSERVTFFVVKIARMLGLDQTRIEELQYAGYLHDIGKIGIDLNILQKNGKLDAAEYELVKNHPLIGERIIAPIEFLKGIRASVSQHHERYDGLGYPLGITGREMTLEARILSVADAYDAMITDRPYRRALPKESALAELRRCSGTQFDPEVVEVFIEILESDVEVRDLEKSLSSVGT
jgi:HD-GYP domain-containing protein (c-di-GMP phosphodiesterase class II)/HAMP domain-containing protein